MTPFTPLNSNFKARTQDSFSRQPLMTFIGAQLGEVAPGYCEIILPYRVEVTQQHGFLHGGMVSVLLDGAGGYSTHTLLAEDSAVLTVEYKVNMLKPGKGKTFIAKGEVVKAGKTLFVVKADLFNEEDTLLATSLQTLMRMEGMHDQIHVPSPS